MHFTQKVIFVQIAQYSCINFILFKKKKIDIFILLDIKKVKIRKE